MDARRQDKRHLRGNRADTDTRGGKERPWFRARQAEVKRGVGHACKGLGNFPTVGDLGTRRCGIDRETLGVLLSKPERIAAFDAKLVDKLRALIGTSSAALVEVAGRDSVAAAITAAKSGSYDILIPTVVYTGTEYGNWEVVLESVQSLHERLGDTDSVQVTEEAVILGSPGWWHVSAGRYNATFFNRYGFNPICIACHMYLHAARVPFALDVGANAVISGERLRHGDRVKLNQLGVVLDSYSAVLEAGGLALDLPLRETSDGALIEDLVGQWPESGRQMSCVLESNYRGAEGGVSYEENLIASYLEEFLMPFTKRVLEEFKRGDMPPDYSGIASRLLAERRIV